MVHERVAEELAGLEEGRVPRRERDRERDERASRFERVGAVAEERRDRDVEPQYDEQREPAEASALRGLDADEREEEREREKAAGTMGRLWG